MQGLNDKRVIVTGGGSGIGRAICQRFGEEGSIVAIFDINGSSAEATAAMIRDAGGKADAFRTDITDRNDVFKAVGDVQRNGPIDVLVNNAG